MPHSGRIKKIFCEGLAAIDLDTIADNIVNSLNENDINSLKLYYKKDDFKKDFSFDLRNNVNFDIYSNVDPIKNEISFFEIVKLSKRFEKTPKINDNSPLSVAFNAYLSSSTPVLIEKVVIEKFNWVQFENYLISKRLLNDVKLIMKIFNYENVPLSEGDTINIRISNFSKDLFTEKNILNNILKPAIMRLFSKINFNFTFLIELDPLD